MEKEFKGLGKIYEYVILLLTQFIVMVTLILMMIQFWILILSLNVMTLKVDVALNYCKDIIYNASDKKLMITRQQKLSVLS